MADSTPASQEGYAGQQGPTDQTNDFNKMVFLFDQLASLNRICTLVKVLSVTNAGELAPVGTVSVQPLIQMTDGAAVVQSHGEIFAVPYFRVQGGADAVIIDPKIGDIGVCVFADRDISTVKSTKAEGPPGSWRKNDMADGLYIASVLNGTPDQFIQFNANGITITDKSGNTIVMNTAGISFTDDNGNSIAMGASGVLINGVLIDRSGNVKMPGEVTWLYGTGGAVDGSTHKHSQGVDSRGDTEQDTSGPLAG